VCVSSDTDIVIYMISDEGFDEVVWKNFSEEDQKIVLIKPYITETKSLLIIGFEYGKLVVMNLEDEELTHLKINK